MTDTSAEFIPVRKARALTETEIGQWLAAARAHPWGLCGKSITQVAEAVTQWVRLRECDFLRPGFRNLAALSGISPTTARRAMIALVAARFLQQDTQGSHDQGQAAMFSLLWNQVAEGQSPSVDHDDSWLGYRELWTGYGYGGTARRIAERITLSGAEGTTSSELAGALRLHRDTVRAWALRFADDGFVDAVRQRRKFWLRDLSPEQTTSLGAAALLRRNAPLVRERISERNRRDRYAYADHRARKIQAT